MSEKRIALVGAGMMGEALLSGLLRSGHDAASVVVVEKHAGRAAGLAERYGVAVTPDVADAGGADTVLLVVKPQDVTGVLSALAPGLEAGRLIVSLAAGVSIAAIEALVPEGVAVARVMPNTPALMGEGMSAISAGAHCGPEHIAEAEALLGAVGRSVQVPEAQQDAVTAISGSGPAYVFLVAESMIEAGVHLGLPRATAHELVAQTLVGAAAMLRDSGEHPATLREQVTSPGGTTAAALRQFEEHGLRAAFLAALEAARDRSRELGG